MNKKLEKFKKKEHERHIHDLMEEVKKIRVCPVCLSPVHENWCLQCEKVLPDND